MSQGIGEGKKPSKMEQKPWILGQMDANKHMLKKNEQREDDQKRTNNQEVYSHSPR